MSYLLGPISGALVAGGVYYGFSNMIQVTTMQHRSDLHKLSQHLLNASTDIVAPLSAADRIEHRPLATMIESRWNAQVESLFRGTRRLNQQATEWGRETLYGIDSQPKEKST